MNYQPQNPKKHKDPFSVLSLPKSFYHPSPTKDVDEREAIKSPQRRSDPTTLCGQEEQFLRGGPTFKASALPDIRTLCEHPGGKSDLLREKDKTSSSRLNESWPESEMPSSVSASGNTSGVTFATEDSEATSPNIGGIISSLGRLKYAPNSADTAVNGVHNNTSGAAESVLQRYIERFRTSAPKSREERLKESGDKPQFWWLHSSPDSRFESAEARPGESIRQPNDLKESTSEPHGKRQLTKEALLTLDEETFHLQTKADRLLSKSELSLASSGPVVSTEGLGSATSVSSSSVIEDKEPYQPALAKYPESYHRLEPKPLARKEERSRSTPPASSSPADDILIRWRLRRKMDEASAAPVFGHLDNKFPSMKPLRHPGLDSQLEEFRKKILSQRALVTHEDICYERQRMTIMMDDILQDGSVLRKEISQIASQPSEPTKDTVLERMQKITGSRNIEAATLHLGQERRLPASSLSTNLGHNFSINNANFSNAGLHRNSNHSLTALNKNNTASSDYQILHDTNLNNDRSQEFIVDSFESQVVCDPKKKEVFLGSSTTESHGDAHCYPGDEGVQDLITGKERAEVEESVKDQSPAGNVREVNAVITDSQRGKAEKIESKENAENDKTKSYKESQGNAKSSTLIINGNIKKIASREGEKDVDKVQKNVHKRGNENFYQFLEAEKPISESKGSMIKLEKKDKLMTKDCSSKSICSEERGENVKELTLGDGDRRVIGDMGLAREQENRKRRTKAMKVRDEEDEDSAGSEVLSDITNECDHQSGELSERPYSHRRNDSKKNMFNENKDLNICRLKPGPVQVSSEFSPRCKTVMKSRGSLSEQQPVQHAIGQAVTDHLFDGSMLLSSQDSWASMFPQSPGLSHSRNGSAFSSTPSQRGNLPFESPIVQNSSSDQQGDEECVSDGEFSDDPLLQILRQQRDIYIQQLKNIEKKLQHANT